MKNLKNHLGLTTIALVSLAGASRSFAQTFPLLPGGIVVSVYGDAGTPGTLSGVTPIAYADGNATPISLQEYTAALAPEIDNAGPLLDESLPTTGTGNNVGIVGEFGSSSEGTIQLSGDGKYLSIAGYDGNLAENGAPQGGYSNANGTPEAQSTDTLVPRVGALINIATGAVDTSTVLNDIYNTQNPRSLYAVSGGTGSSLYFSGQGASKSDQGGIYATTDGTNTSKGSTGPTAIYTGSSTRTVTQVKVDATNGKSSTAANTYVSLDQDSRSVATSGIFEYAGNPAANQPTMGTRITLASGTVGGKTVEFSPEGFFFANATTLYVADTGLPKNTSAGADGGIQKWSYVGNGLPWKLDYTLTYNFASPTSLIADSAETGFATLSGTVLKDGQVDLFATSYTAGDVEQNGLYGVSDTLSDVGSAPVVGEVIDQLAVSKLDSEFKGVVYIPEPSTYGLLGVGAMLLFWQRRRRP